MGAGEARPVPVSQVDLQQYAKRWYQYAALPQWFQDPSATDVTANYALVVERGRNPHIAITNTETISRDDRRSVYGTAWANPPSSSTKVPGRLLVQFSGASYFTLLWPFPAAYWIIMLAPDYRYAVVSNATGSALWILSASPVLAPTDEQFILEKLKSTHGFTPEMLSKLVRTRHSSE